MRSTKGLLLLAAVAASVAASPVTARDAGRSAPQAEAGRAAATEVSAQARRRPATRLRVYRETLPPNAVRTCDAWYVQEFRPSGPVIVPRMRCRWVAG